ncbi:superoxide dismutase family protein [Planococcus sp. ISL-109]|uniref:superoxide dismutase family protein n=1 Tax=Planococcus sp. ISL-109 TaxID=2819166 RepID=UPI001BEAA7CA|nr:superoxide dismutase family protein [Planococcus sp. ISL-109]MBT2582681.1 superoxide dismutase family protein [Planococcus sp. ISL-109]
MKSWLKILLLGLVLLLAACGDDTDEPPTETDGAGDAQEEEVEGEEETPPEGSEADPEDSSEIQMLTVEFLNVDGDAIGTAELTEEDTGVLVKLNVEGLEPGTHGIHFHEEGLCEAPDFESAGGHFNPTGASHGHDNPDGPHAGDLKNIEVADDGTSMDELTAENLTLQIGEDNSLLKEGGTALVIHASADDGQTDPSGDSGDRIACGVVTTE